MRALRRASLTGAVAGLFGILVMLSPWGDALEERFGLGWLFWTRGPVAAPSDVAVVSLDSGSREHLGLPEKLREWPRRLYARLIERLVEADVSVIVFDLRLDQAREPEQDAALAEAIAKAKRVVLFEHIDHTRLPLPGEEDQTVGVLATEQLRPPLDAFAQAAVGLGPFPLPKVPARVSQFWAFRPGGEATLPVVALQRHAAKMDEDWHALLHETGYPDADQLPSDLTRLTDPSALRRYMLEIRNRVRTDPQLGQRMSALLAPRPGNTQHRRLLAALLEAYKGPDSRYLNYYGAAGHVQTIALHAALDGGWRTQSGEPVNLSGRIVFVGQSDLMNLHTDGFITVFSRDDGIDLSGVEIGATAVANLLDGRLIDPAGPGLVYTLLGAFGLAIGAIAGAFHAPIAVPVALLLAGAVYAGAHSAFVQGNLWLPVVTPLLVQLPLGLFLGLLLQYRDAHRAKANLSRGMGYYLPRKVALGFAEAAVDPASLKERVFAACMVTDASRFTTLAEAMAPEELSEFLDQYFAILFGVVERHGGLVTDVVGDGTTSVWTAPKAERACRLRACLAAVEIERAIGAFNREHHPRSLPTRIGLNAGDAIVGNVGGSGRFAYSVVGDCVNTAARLETLNKQVGTQIIAASAVIEGLDEIVTRPLGRFQLFGKGEALQVVEVVGRAADAPCTELVPDFVEALEEFEQGHWADAARRFETILAAQPLDGPAAFYRKYCHQYMDGTSVPTAHGAIRLESK